MDRGLSSTACILQRVFGRSANEMEEFVEGALSAGL